MASGKDKTTWLVGSGFGLLMVLLIGSGLGYLFAGELFQHPAHSLMISLALGFVWALFLLQWVDIMGQSLALASDPVPNSLDLSDRAAVKTHVAKLTGGGLAVSRARRLLNAWAEGADAQQIISVASLQSGQARNALRGTALFVLILLVGAMWQGGETALAWGAFVAIAVTLYARHNLLSNIDRYLEERLLSRLPGNAAAAVAGMGEEAGLALGNAVQQAFSQYIPQPESMGKALSQAMDTAAAKAAQAFDQSGAKAAEALVQAAAKTSEATAGAGAKTAEATEKLEGALASHADQVQAANQQLGAHLDRIAELAGSIDQVLKVQQTVDNTIKSVTATEEFKESLSALRNHVEESDKLLRELAKPRKIRLVESGHAAQG